MVFKATAVFLIPFKFEKLRCGLINLSLHYYCSLRESFCCFGYMCFISKPKVYGDLALETRYLFATIQTHKSFRHHGDHKTVMHECRLLYHLCVCHMLNNNLINEICSNNFYKLL